MGFSSALGFAVEVARDDRGKRPESVLRNNATWALESALVRGWGLLRVELKF